MKYVASYYRAARDNEIGPIAEAQVIASSSKKDALKTAKNLAIQYDWRFLDLLPMEYYSKEVLLKYGIIQEATNGES